MNFLRKGANQAPTTPAAGTQPGTTAGVYANPMVRSFLAGFLPLIVGAIRLVLGLLCIMALLLAHFKFGREGFASVIKFGIEANLFGVTTVSVSPMIIATMLELVSLAAQTVLWDMRLTGRAVGLRIQALFWTIMILCGLVSISVLTHAMFAQDTSTILPTTRSLGYFVLAILVLAVTMYDSKYIDVIINAMHEGASGSLLFGNGAIRNFLYRTCMTIVSVVRIAIMTAGTLSLMALSWLLLEVTLTSMLPHDSGLLVSLLAFASVCVPVVMAEIMLYSKVHKPSLETKIAFGVVVVLVGVLCAAAVPHLMFQEGAVNLFASREHFSPMYAVVTALVAIYTIGDSYLIFWFLESLRGEQGTASTNQP
jgi:hypothetical protein